MGTFFALDSFFNIFSDIKLSELIAYFKQDFEPFSKLFTHLENIHGSLSSLLHSTAGKYKDLDFYQQYKIRFFLREFSNQLSSLQHPVEAAITGLEKQSAASFNRTHHYESVAVTTPTYTNTTNVSDDVLQLRQQVDRLAQIVGKLDAKPIRIEASEEEIFADTENDEAYLVVSRSMHVKSDQVENYKKDLKKYLRATKKEEGCYR